MNFAPLFPLVTGVVNALAEIGRHDRDENDRRHENRQRLLQIVEEEARERNIQLQRLQQERQQEQIIARFQEITNNFIQANERRDLGLERQELRQEIRLLREDNFKMMMIICGLLFLAYYLFTKA